MTSEYMSGILFYLMYTYFVFVNLSRALSWKNLCKNTQREIRKFSFIICQLQCLSLLCSNIKGYNSIVSHTIVSNVKGAVIIAYLGVIFICFFPMLAFFFIAIDLVLSIFPNICTCLLFDLYNCINKGGFSESIECLSRTGGTE